MTAASHTQPLPIASSRSVLGAIIDAQPGRPGDWTVQSAQTDPFRNDTPAGHRDGAWFAATRDAIGRTEPLHLRGFHYAFLGQPKPNGEPYSNTAADWEWLQNKAAKGARWLSYIAFEDVVDNRNTPPVVKLWKPPQPLPTVSVDVSVMLPDAADLTPRAAVKDFTGTQPYHIVFIGEKASLREVLGPEADRVGADLYLPTGELSDSMIHQMARLGVADGRKMVCLYFSDCDPSGYGMPISLCRKLQAFTELDFPDLQWEVHRAALTPEHVRTMDLPSTPMKETERRAGKWFKRFSLEQTEIDSLATLRPDDLRQIVRDVVKPFRDKTLDGRVIEARRAWEEGAQAVIESAEGADADRVRDQAAEELERLQSQIDDVLAGMQIDPSMYELPPVQIPTANPSPTPAPEPLCSSDDTYADQTTRLMNDRL